MNIGLDAKNSYIDSSGVAILTEKLQSTFCIKCHFSENDKTPNTDGFFVLSNDTCPEKEFHVQIKSTQEITNSTFKYDTKFINYINSGVTDNPGFLFAVDITNKTVYFKYLSEEFLNSNNFTENEQKTTTIHFDDNEILTDTNSFVEILNNIVLSSKIKGFKPKQIDITEYQNAFDKLNNFFDLDFKKLKEKIYPNVWKFGIIYNREKLTKSVYEEIKKQRDKYGIGTSRFDSTFSVYTINYGSTQNIFQNFKLGFNENIKLPIHSYISHGVATENNLESDIDNWLSKTFKDLINFQFVFIPFVPNDALFEILYNFIDKEVFKNNNQVIKDYYEQNYKNGNISLSTVSKMIKSKYPYEKVINQEIILVKSAIDELAKRDITEIKRVWKLSRSLDKTFPLLFDSETDKNNINKLFLNMPQYYNDFITNLFPEQYISKYSYKGEYIMSTSVKFENSFIDKIKRYKINPQKDFSITLVDYIDEKEPFDNIYTIKGCGIIEADFSLKTNNILNNILHMLYETVCLIHNFKKDFLQFRADF